MSNIIDGIKHKVKKGDVWIIECTSANIEGDSERGETYFIAEKDGQDCDFNTIDVYFVGKAGNIYEDSKSTILQRVSEMGYYDVKQDLEMDLPVYLNEFLEQHPNGREE